MQLSAPDLVRLVMQREGIDPNTPSAPRLLADNLGWPDRSAPQKVRRWLKEVNEPSYADLLLLLSRAGLLRDSPGRSTGRAGGVPDAVIVRAIQALTATVDELESLLAPPERQERQGKAGN